MRIKMKTLEIKIFFILISLFYSGETMVGQNLVQRQPAAAQDTIYEQEINAWHERRINSLKREHGWLSLVALDWLSEGKNVVPNIGMITIHKQQTELLPLPNIKAALNGKPFLGGILRTDADSVGPDKIQVGTKAFVIIKRGDRFALRMWDSEAPSRVHFSGIERFPVNSQWRIEARWQPYSEPKKIKVPSVISGFVEESPVPGIAVFSINEKEYKLEPIGDSDAKEYFFIFADKTSGKETYGAGRFLYAKPPKDGKIVLDFNTAYNPPCAFTPYATCPLPPPENKLEVRIEAGEKKFGDH